MDEVTLWERALDDAELSALAGGQPLVNAFVKQPREGRVFGNGVLAAFDLGPGTFDQAGRKSVIVRPVAHRQLGVHQQGQRFPMVGLDGEHGFAVSDGAGKVMGGFGRPCRLHQ